MGKSNIANRGLDFESLIENKCQELEDREIAIIHKVPTEWKVKRRYNPQKKRTEIFNAFPVAESKFVDFIGAIYNKPIAIEAKETKEEKRFDFKNIKDTQIEFLKLWSKLGNQGYYIIRFTEHKEVYLVKSEIMHDWIDNLGRKSVPYEILKSTKDVILLDYKNLNFEEYIK